MAAPSMAQRPRSLTLSPSGRAIAPHGIPALAARPQAVRQLGRAAPPQRRPRCAPVLAAAKKAAAVAAAASTAAFPGLQEAVAPLVPAAVAASVIGVGALALLMALLPTSQLARRAARSNAPFVLLALAYGLVLAASWQADTLALMMPGSWAEGFKGGFNPQFIPSIASVQALFSRSFTSASFLLHAAFINLFSARVIYNQGMSTRLPVAHSVLLAAFAGPLGLLSHALTQALYAVASAVVGRDLRPRPQVIKAVSGPGVIEILQYDDK